MPVETVEIDRGFEKLISNLHGAKGSFVDIGMFGGKLGPGGQSILTYFLANEFGTENEDGTVRIPERSTLRSTVDEHREMWLKKMEEGLSNIALDKESTNAFLTRLGIEIRRAISQKMVNLKTPANAQSTIDRKGSSNPLIDSGTMRKALAFKLGKQLV